MRRTITVTSDQRRVQHRDRYANDRFGELVILASRRLDDVAVERPAVKLPGDVRVGHGP